MDQRRYGHAQGSGKQHGRTDPQHHRARSGAGRDRDPAWSDDAGDSEQSEVAQAEFALEMGGQQALWHWAATCLYLGGAGGFACQVSRYSQIISPWSDFSSPWGVSMNGAKS